MSVTLGYKSLSDIPRKAVWPIIVEEAKLAAAAEPVLASFYHSAILNHASFAEAISFHLAHQLQSQIVPAMVIREVFEVALAEDTVLEQTMRADILAHRTRDPACETMIMPLLFFKGFHALQAWRIAHHLWSQGRYTLALYLQNQISQVFDVDIHPAAVIGRGIMLDHATGIVIGETAVVGNNVSMLHGVTLGGNGLIKGKRHPDIGCGVLIGAGAKILGHITIGEGAKIAAGSVVLHSVEAHTTVAGVPAKVVGRPSEAEPALNMNHQLPDDESQSLCE